MSHHSLTEPMPLEKVLELVCAHAELQSEHERLKKKVKLLNSEIEEMTLKRSKESTARFESLVLTSERHIAALSLNCDETMRRKFREVDEMMLQMRRDMFDRVSAAIASSPPPAVKRLRTVASQVTAASAQKYATSHNASTTSAVGGTSTNISQRQDEMTNVTPMARKVHALAELVSMSADSSMNDLQQPVESQHNPNEFSSYSNTNNSSSSSSYYNNNTGGSVQPTVAQQAGATTLHQNPRLYEPMSQAHAGASQSMQPQPHYQNQQQQQQQNQVQSQPPSVRYDATPGLNTSASQPPVSSVSHGTTPYEGEMHTFLW